MPKSSALFAVCFVAGLLGALASSLFLWGCNEWSITTFIGVKIVQTLELTELYPQMFIGGFWGLGYFFTVGIPRHRRFWVRKGLWFSLIPSLTAIFYLYPYIFHKGMAGFDLGMLTPLLIVLSNMVWGIFTGFFCPPVLGSLIHAEAFLLSAEPVLPAGITIAGNRTFWKSFMDL